jgi:hypothetical protein
LLTPSITMLATWFGILRDRTHRDVSLLIGLLQLIIVWRNVLLRQSFHLVRIVLVLFLFLLDNALFQAATLRLSVGRRIEPSLLLAAIADSVPRLED